MNCKNPIKNENGRVKIVPPTAPEERIERTVVFRCKNKENGKILNPPLEEISKTYVPNMDGRDRILLGRTGVQNFGIHL